MRRELNFKNFDEIRTELKNLEGKELETAGKWSFYQLLDHLAASLEWAMKESDSFLSGEPLFKPAVGRRFYQRMEKAGKMPDGVENPNSPTEFEAGDEQMAMQQLRDCLDRFESYEGPFTTHLIFGDLSIEEWRLWARFHCAHHLGFVKIKGS